MLELHNVSLISFEGTCNMQCTVNGSNLIDINIDQFGNYIGDINLFYIVNIYFYTFAVMCLLIYRGTTRNIGFLTFPYLNIKEGNASNPITSQILDLNIPIQCLLHMTTIVKISPMKAANNPNSLNGRHIFISFQRRASDIFLCLSTMLECCGLSFIMVLIPAIFITLVVFNNL